MIQENFLDSYHNLTYKSVMWLRWTAEYCPKAKYLLKMDDDIFVNIFKMVDWLKMLEKKNSLKNIKGRQINNEN